MREQITWLLAGLACGWAGVAGAQLQLVPDAVPQQVFAGEARNITVIWRNPRDTTAGAEVRARVVQTASAIAARLGEVPWKKLQVFPQQTVIESALFDFPEVKAETKFLIQWLADTNQVLGKTEVLVYPTNLLTELKPLAGEDRAVGIFDPGDTLKPLLNAVRVEFEDLEDSGIADFRGRLAIIGPFASRQTMPGDLVGRIEKLARKGAGVVWIQPPPGPRDHLKPTFYAVPVGAGAVVVVQASLVAGLDADPQAQLNLLHCCRLAQEPEPLSLPVPSPQPENQ